MKVKVSDYIAQFLVDKNINDIFTVTGGGAMHLNDSFGHNPHLHCTYNHNEQASAMSAEAYARLSNKIAAVCVTTGPGATNAITGVVCGWMGSIPMLVFSGQARYDTTIHTSGLNLRTRGVQEFDVITSVRNMTKYSELISDPNKIKYCLEKAYFEAITGRPGPCWLDIPLNVQSSFIETDELIGYEPVIEEKKDLNNYAEKIIEKINDSKKPILFLGNGIRLANAHSKVLELIDVLKIPVVCGMGSVDAISSYNKYFVGRTGTTGDRAANFAVQSSDLFISLGSRLGYFTTGFNTKEWAPKAYKIVNDIDVNELKKDSINANLIIPCNVSDLIDELLDLLKNKSINNYDEWNQKCLNLKDKYPVVLKKHYDDIKPNIYSFYKEMTLRTKNDDVIIGSCGTSRVVGSQASIIKEGVRFITNSVTASMGYDLPAAIGCCVASKRRTILVTGEGSLQMNIQEFQTIVQNKLPVILFIMNNGGYHSIRMTQNSFFGNPLVGVGPESRDLSFPDMKKIAYAYGIDYKKCEYQKDMINCIDWALSYNDKPCICEMVLSTTQVTEPKVSSKKLPDGKMVSGTFQDMAPFLPQEEIEENMN